MVNTMANDSGKRKTGKQWFRSWREKVFSDKVWMLTPEQYRTWDFLLCMTDIDGNIPPLRRIAFVLRTNLAEAERRLAELIEAEFVDPVLNGAQVVGYRMHDWEQWQRRCDAVDQTVSERMKRYRKRKKKAVDRNAAVTVTEFRSESVSASENTASSVRSSHEGSEEVEVGVYARESR